jgi:hypothetical protein
VASDRRTTAAGSTAMGIGLILLDVVVDLVGGHDRMNFLLRAAFSAIFFIGYSNLASAGSEHWPKHLVSDEWRAQAAEIAKTPGIRRGNFDVVPYDYEGKFLGWDTLNPGKYRNSDAMKLDEDGVPLVKQDGKFQYNPVTVAQFGLKRYSKNRNDDLLKAADRLILLQRSDGAFTYDFSYPDYWVGGASYKPGWVSGMAQGQALSVFARAYYLTHNGQYLKAGERALSFMQVPFPKGPMTDLSSLDPSLRSYSFIAEYPNNPQCYTLNGYIFTLLGLYDWWKEIGSPTARHMFEDGSRTLEKIVPYYDIGAFSAYDLCYITRARHEPYLNIKPLMIAGYQGFHVELLAVMYQLTGKKIFDEYAKKFFSQTEASPN